MGIYFNCFPFHYLDFELISLIHYPWKVFFKYSCLEYRICIGSSSYINLSDYGEAISNETLISSNITIKQVIPKSSSNFQKKKLTTIKNMNLKQLFTENFI